MQENIIRIDFDFPDRQKENLQKLNEKLSQMKLSDLRLENEGFYLCTCKHMSADNELLDITYDYGLYKGTLVCTMAQENEDAYIFQMETDVVPEASDDVFDSFKDKWRRNNPDRIMRFLSGRVDGGDKTAFLVISCTKDERSEVKAAKAFVQQVFAHDASGHDAFHTLRVLKLAERIAREEGADMLTVQLAALLHDVDDRKLSPGTYHNQGRARAFLHSQGMEMEKIDEICDIIADVSFKGTDSVVPLTLEGRCVQDADRLDAIGAIGIARTFAFGGSRGRKMYDPAEPPQVGMNAAAYASNEGHTVNHFYEKLLLLKDMMTTDTAMEIAEQRHAYMLEFLHEFMDEWNGER